MKDTRVWEIAKSLGFKEVETYHLEKTLAFNSSSINHVYKICLLDYSNEYRLLSKERDRLGIVSTEDFLRALLELGVFIGEQHRAQQIKNLLNIK